MADFLEKFREVSHQRDVEIMEKFNKGNHWNIDDWVIKLHEETGELLAELVAYIKSDNNLDKEQLLKLIREEFADVIITGDLLLQQKNESLQKIIIDKFNKTSDKLDVKTKMEIQ